MSDNLIDRLRHADLEIESGDYVTLSRRFQGCFVDECLMTFSGITITRTRNANHAETFQKSTRDT